MTEISTQRAAIDDRDRPLSRSGSIPGRNVLSRLLDHLEEWLIAALISAATVLIFLAVLHRYGTGVSIDLSKWAAAHGFSSLAAFLKAIFLQLAAVDVSWAQELCIYMFIWMAKFGAAYGVRTGIHVGVDVLVNILPAGSRRRVITFSLLCGAFFTSIVAAFGASFVSQMWHTGQQSNDLEAPMWIVYLAIPLGSSLMCFRFLQVAWSFYRTGELPHHDASRIDGVEVDALHPAEVKPREIEKDDRKALGWIIILLPILIVAVCFAHAGGLIVLPQGLRVATVFALLLALMLTGMPISIALGLTVLSFMFTLTDVRTELVALKLFTGIESFEIMAIPFFILAGNFLTHGGVARRMIAFATAMVGHWYGGLALAAVLACALFAAISGSSPATVVAIGSVILPAMVAQGFPKRFGAGVITTSGSLGILIPPSIPMVLFAVSTNTSVGKLFIAGIVPGVALATMLGATTWYRAWRNDYPRMPKATFAERLNTFRNSIWGLLLIVIVIGGIYTGLFTPTEAAAVSAVYAFIVAVFIYKDLKLRDVPRVLLSSANLSAMLLYIITNAVLVLVPDDLREYPARPGTMDDRPGVRLDRLPAGRQPAAADGRKRDGAVVDHPDHGTDSLPGCGKARDRSDSLRHSDDGEHGSRAVSSAGRLEPLCRLRNSQDGDHRADHRGLAVVAHHAGIPCHRDLLARSNSVSPDAAWDALVPVCV